MNQTQRAVVRSSVVVLLFCLGRPAQAFVPSGGLCSSRARPSSSAAATAASTPLPATEASAGGADAVADVDGEPSSPVAQRRGTWVRPFVSNPAAAAAGDGSASVDAPPTTGDAPAFMNRPTHFDMSASAAPAASSPEKASATPRGGGGDTASSSSVAEKQPQVAAAPASLSSPSASRKTWVQPSHPPTPVDAATAKRAADLVAGLPSRPGSTPTFMGRQSYYDLSASAAASSAAAQPAAPDKAAAATTVAQGDTASSSSAGEKEQAPSAAAASASASASAAAAEPASSTPATVTVVDSSPPPFSDATASAAAVAFPASPNTASSSSGAPVAAEKATPPPLPTAAKFASSPLPPVEFEPEPTLLSDSPVYQDVELTIKRVKDTLAPFGKKIQDNVAEGNVGERGEEWALAQFVILVFVAMGSVPLFGGLISLLAGPGLVAGGIGVCAAGLKGLGKSLSPWPAPIDDNELNTEGIYGIMRHPMYTGLAMFCLGFGVTTNSPLRMLLAVLLALVLDKKADKEEKMLIGLHGKAYEDYREMVAKFVPRFY